MEVLVFRSLIHRHLFLYPLYKDKYQNWIQNEDNRKPLSAQLNNFNTVLKTTNWLDSDSVGNYHRYFTNQKEKPFSTIVISKKDKQTIVNEDEEAAGAAGNPLDLVEDIYQRLETERIETSVDNNEQTGFME